MRISDWSSDVCSSDLLGVIEFDGREETFEESIELARRFAARGLDLLDVSIGFNIPGASIPWGPAFMAPLAERIRRAAAIPTAMSWLINDPQQADSLVRAGTVDLVMLGPPLLDNPHWPSEDARGLGIHRAASVLPEPYAPWLERSRPA